MSMTAAGFEPRRVGEGVAQHQSALGIGIEYLDGFARHAGNHVTGLGSGATGHVLCGSDDANDVQGQGRLR
jgi:hypothetical protein